MSGLSGFSEADACDVGRSLCGDILLGPSSLWGLSERSCGGRPLRIRSVAGNRLIEEAAGAASLCEPREMAYVIRDDLLARTFWVGSGR